MTIKQNIVDCKKNNLHSKYRTISTLIKRDNSLEDIRFNKDAKLQPVPLDDIGTGVDNGFSAKGI
jgi:hypothetical protein